MLLLFGFSNIIKKREQFEYKLARPHKECVDYLDYIRYERSVLKLIRERNRTEHKLVNLVTQRIKGLYNQSTKRFPQRKPLWDEYFVFVTGALAKCDNSEVSAVLDDTILHHGHHVDSWLKYVKWERAVQQQTGNETTKVRNLLMRALQTHRTNEQLHLELLDVELANDRKLPVVNVCENATLVYQNAMTEFRADKSVPVDRILAFQAAVQDQLVRYPFTKQLQLMVLDDVEDKYLLHELFWHHCAQRELKGQLTADEQRNKQLDIGEPAIESHKVNIRRCVQVYEGAVAKINTPQMWSFYLDAMLALNENSKTTLPVLKRSVLGCAFKAAFASQKISEQHCVQYIAIMQATGATDNAISQLIDGSLAMHPKSTSLWEAKMKFHIQCNEDSKVDGVFVKAKQKLGNDSAPIWSLYLKYLFALDGGGASAKIKSFFRDVITQPHENFRFLKADCIEHLATLFGVNEARKFFNDAFRNGFPCLEMYHRMIDIEELQVKSNRFIDRSTVKNLIFFDFPPTGRGRREKLAKLFDSGQLQVRPGQH